MKVPMRKTVYWCPADGQVDLQIVGLEPREEGEFGPSILINFANLGDEDHGKTFGIFYSIANVTPRTKLGRLLSEFGVDVDTLAERGEEVDLDSALLHKRIAAVVITEDSDRGRKVKELRVMKIYAKGKGPSLDSDVVPF